MRTQVLPCGQLGPGLDALGDQFWAESMLVVPRLLERYGDHGVDIGEQTIFVVSGTAVELSSNAPSNP